MSVGETGGASGAAGFAGTRLQAAPRPKLGGSRSEAHQGRSPKVCPRCSLTWPP